MQYAVTAARFRYQLHFIIA